MLISNQMVEASSEQRGRAGGWGGGGGRIRKLLAQRNKVEWELVVTGKGQWSIEKGILRRIPFRDAHK